MLLVPLHHSAIPRGTFNKYMKRTPRGLYRIAHSTTYPNMVALAWMDPKPVNMIATGSGTHPTTVVRREKDGSITLILGIVDMALVNGLIVHNIARKRRSEKSTTHATYLRRLHKELLALREDHFDRHPVAEDLKRKSYETSYVCPTCSDSFDGRVSLCPKIRRMTEENTLTCTQIWHDVWNDGRYVPPHLSAIRFRKPKRKRSERNE
ncbi:hypothetical protein PHMEG_00028012 [Phytophthora megakarya]|uniref:PiggyBac transposable element-derived protein domain-containing protein n=1 Tax=Phytophthora megakarya TaxID=4795 RepID=A0A225V7L2_9STRA|nr:hypothetical protein PHMEG_00028012 [Phytophthora megakarya]